MTTDISLLSYATCLKSVKLCQKMALINAGINAQTSH